MREAVGAVSVFPLVQFHYRVPPARFFPDLAERGIDENAWYWQEPYLDDGMLVIDMGGFLLRTPDRAILVDLGIGDGKDRPNPNHRGRDDGWLRQLRHAGTEPSEVDTVVFTHLHVDHVGHATMPDGSLTFPGVPHLTTEAEFAYWTSPAAKPELDRLGDYIADSVLPVRDAGLLQLVEPDLELCPQVRLRPAPGHTPGNVCVEVRSDGARAIFAGDMVHHALQLAFPDWSTDYCVDKAGATRARRALLADLADTGTLLFPAHFPGSMPGTVVSVPGGGYRFEPPH